MSDASDHPAHSPPIPGATRLTARPDRDDLALPQETLEEVRRVIVDARTLSGAPDTRGPGAVGATGHTCLFEGPSDAGMERTAELVAAELGAPLYRVDLSRIVSKYIGETEKNLARLFDRAGSEGAVLFLDEADALFGKRTAVKDAHDRYGDLEVSYLLQRIERYPGLVILATNRRSDLDPGLVRRVGSVVDFTPGPRPRSRRRPTSR